MYLPTLATSSCNIFWVDNFDTGPYDCYGYDYPSAEAFLGSGTIQCDGGPYLGGQAWMFVPNVSANINLS
jgi:hypothetical protein